MKKLVVPENITLAWELFPGLGKSELRRCLLSFIPGLIVTILICSILSSPGATLGGMVFFLAYMASCIAIFIKQDNYQSIYTFLTQRVRFQREQQNFYYKPAQEVIRFVSSSEED